jgi:hypothetical protein
VSPAAGTEAKLFVVNVNELSTVLPRVIGAVDHSMPFELLRLRPQFRAFASKLSSKELTKTLEVGLKETHSTGPELLRVTLTGTVTVIASATPAVSARIRPVEPAITSLWLYLFLIFFIMAGFNL